MALIGGGGAGNVGGGNPSGTGTTLNYIGDHAYAYSGTFEATASLQTMLEFTTGSVYLYGQLQCNGSIKTTDIGGGALTAFQISADGQVISLLKITGSAETAPYDATQELILPPYTKIKVECISSGTASGFLSTSTFVGRVYG